MTHPWAPSGAGSRRLWRRAALMLSAASLGWVTATAGVPPRPAFAQAPQATAPAASPDDAALSQAQLEQLLAPVALYPDDLLMQVLMAATYPLEIVQAQRWLQQGQNAQLRGDALEQALQAQSWDPSVKSLVPFPDVLSMMNDQLDWTQQLGDALLAQQQDVLNTVQVLRNRAQAAGHLQSGPQQTVTVSQTTALPPTTSAAVGGETVIVQAPPQTIVIQPAQPNVVYVPVYNPNVVFGTWPNPTYPPTYWPPPPSYNLGSALLTGMAFAAGAAIVGSLWGWATPRWGGSGNTYINVNANRFNNINVNRTQINSNRWQHDVTHRQGVAYRNTEVQNRFRGTTAGSSLAARDATASRDAFRGRMDQVERGGSLTGGDRPGLSGERPGGGDRPNLGGGDRPNLGGGDRPNLGGGDRPNLGGSDRPNLGGGDRPNLGGGDRPNLGGGDRPNLGGSDRPNLGGQGPGAGNRPNLGDRTPGQLPAGGNRPNLGDRAPSAAQRPAIAQSPSGRPQVPQRPAAAPNRSPPAFQGMGAGGADRAAAQRGAASRQAPAARPVAAQRGGGGGGGGGGRVGRH